MRRSSWLRHAPSRRSGRLTKVRNNCCWPAPFCNGCVIARQQHLRNLGAFKLGGVGYTVDTPVNHRCMNHPRHCPDCRAHPEQVWPRHRSSPWQPTLHRVKTKSPREYSLSTMEANTFVKPFITTTDEYQTLFTSKLLGMLLTKTVHPAASSTERVPADAES